VDFDLNGVLEKIFGADVAFIVRQYRAKLMTRTLDG
jgi:hypothetical protein